LIHETHFLFSTTAKPARDTALGFGRLSLYLAVELVHLAPDILCVRLGVSLGPLVLSLCLVGLGIVHGKLVSCISV
jgi:adenosylmethionine-8-amino-7-oxononanoate aminotransferase